MGVLCLFSKDFFLNHHLFYFTFFFFYKCSLPSLFVDSSYFLSLSTLFLLARQAQPVWVGYRADSLVYLPCVIMQPLSSSSAHSSNSSVFYSLISPSRLVFPFTTQSHIMSLSFVHKPILFKSNSYEVSGMKFYYFY